MTTGSWPPGTRLHLARNGPVKPPLLMGRRFPSQEAPRLFDRRWVDPGIASGSGLRCSGEQPGTKEL